MIGWRRSNRRKSTNARKLFSLHLLVLVGGLFYAVFLAPILRVTNIFRKVKKFSSLDVEIENSCENLIALEASNVT